MNNIKKPCFTPIPTFHIDETKREYELLKNFSEVAAKMKNQPSFSLTDDYEKLSICNKIKKL